MTETLQLSLRGLPEWLIREYFVEMGANPTEGAEAAMTAAEWSVSWTHQRVEIAGGSLKLTQFDIIFVGEPDTIQTAHDDFMKKAQRGGG